MIVLLTSLMLFPGESTESVDSLLKKIGPDNPKEVRLIALEKLTEEHLGAKTGLTLKDPARVCRALENFPKEKDIEIRRKMVLSLAMGIIKYKSKFECPKTLVEAIDDEDEEIAAYADAGVGASEKFSKTAIPLIFEAAKSKEPNMRTTAVFALGTLAANSPRAANELKRLMNDPDEGVKYNAHNAHFRATGEFRRYVTFLLRLHSTPHQDLPEETPSQKRKKEWTELAHLSTAIQFYTFNKDRPKELANELIANLTHKESGVRYAALQQLRAMCISSQETYKAIPKKKAKKAVADLFRDENENVSVWAYIVDSHLDDGPPKDAPEKLKPLEEFLRTRLKTETKPEIE